MSVDLGTFSFLKQIYCQFQLHWLILACYPTEQPFRRDFSIHLCQNDAPFKDSSNINISAHIWFQTSLSACDLFDLVFLSAFSWIWIQVWQQVLQCCSVGTLDITDCTFNNSAYFMSLPVHLLYECMWSCPLLEALLGLSKWTASPNSAKSTLRKTQEREGHNNMIISDTWTLFTLSHCAYYLGQLNLDMWTEDWPCVKMILYFQACNFESFLPLSKMLCFSLASLVLVC